jgi:hypothetical protein
MQQLLGCANFGFVGLMRISRDRVDRPFGGRSAGDHDATAGQVETLEEFESGLNALLIWERKDHHGEQELVKIVTSPQENIWRKLSC